MSTQKVKERIRPNHEQWTDLVKLVNSPQQALLLGCRDLKHRIPDYRAEKLVEAGLATYTESGQIIVPTEEGLEVLSEVETVKG